MVLFLLSFHTHTHPYTHSGKARRTVAVPDSKTAEYPAVWSMASDRQRCKKRARVDEIYGKFDNNTTRKELNKEVLAAMRAGQVTVSRGEAPKVMLAGGWEKQVTHYPFKLHFGPPSKRTTIDLYLVRAQAPSLPPSLPPSLSPSPPSHLLLPPLLFLTQRYSHLVSAHKAYKHLVCGDEPECRAGLLSGLASRLIEYNTRFDEEVVAQRLEKMEGWIREMLQDPRGWKCCWGQFQLGRVLEEWTEIRVKEVIEEEVARVEAAYEAQRKEEDEELARPWFVRGALARMWEDKKKEEEEWWRVVKVVGA